eukprot:1507490-Prymnesium_polylepis.1
MIEGQAAGEGTVTEPASEATNQPDELSVASEVVDLAQSTPAVPAPVTQAPPGGATKVESEDAVEASGTGAPRTVEDTLAGLDDLFAASTKALPKASAAAASPVEANKEGGAAGQPAQEEGIDEPALLTAEDPQKQSRDAPVAAATDTAHAADDAPVSAAVMPNGCAEVPPSSTAVDEKPPCDVSGDADEQPSAGEPQPEITTEDEKGPYAESQYAEAPQNTEGQFTEGQQYIEQQQDATEYAEGQQYAEGQYAEGQEAEGQYAKGQYAEGQYAEGQ